MTVRYGMAGFYGTFSAGDTILAEWGNSINNSLDDKISRTLLISTTGDLTFNVAKTITRTSGSWITDGVQDADKIVIAGSSSNNGTYTVASAGVTTLVLTVVESVVTEGPVGATAIIFQSIASGLDVGGNFVAGGFIKTPDSGGIYSNRYNSYDDGYVNQMNIKATKQAQYGSITEQTNQWLIWIPPSDFEISSGSPTLNNEGSDTAETYWSFDAASQRIRTKKEYRIPPKNWRRVQYIRPTYLIKRNGNDSRMDMGYSQDGGGWNNFASGAAAGYTDTYIQEHTSDFTTVNNEVEDISYGAQQQGNSNGSGANPSRFRFSVFSWTTTTMDGYFYGVFITFYASTTHFET